MSTYTHIYYNYIYDNMINSNTYKSFKMIYNVANLQQECFISFVLSKFTQY